MSLKSETFGISGLDINYRWKWKKHEFVSYLNQTFPKSRPIIIFYY